MQDLRSPRLAPWGAVTAAEPPIRLFGFLLLGYTELASASTPTLAQGSGSIVAQEAHRSASVDATASTLRSLADRARRILLHEQRTGHEDAAVKPGGLEAFIAHWAEDVRASRNGSGVPALDGKPVEEALPRLLSGYRALDPMQRAARVRSALALLDGIVGAAPAAPPAPASARPTSPAPTLPAAAPQRTGARPAVSHRPAKPAGAAPARTNEPWPLATPPPPPPVLRSAAEKQIGRAHV